MVMLRLGPQLEAAPILPVWSRQAVNITERGYCRGAMVASTSSVVVLPGLASADTPRRPARCALLHDPSTFASRRPAPGPQRIPAHIWMLTGPPRDLRTGNVVAGRDDHVARKAGGARWKGAGFVLDEANAFSRVPAVAHVFTLARVGEVAAVRRAA